MLLFWQILPVKSVTCIELTAPQSSRASWCSLAILAQNIGLGLYTG